MARLDRVVVLTVRAKPTTNDFGEAVPGAVVFAGPVWAERMDRGTAQNLASSPPFVVSDDTRRTYRVRYRPDLATVTVPRSQVEIDEAGRTFTADRVIEDPRHERRRFHLVEIDEGE